GQTELADHALEAILGRLPSLLTNFITASPDNSGHTNSPDNFPRGNGLQFQPRHDPQPSPQIVEQNPIVPKNEKPETAGNSPPQTGRLSDAFGVAVWDGRSPTMVAAFSGVSAPPEGHEWVVWNANGSTPDAAIGTLHVSNHSNAGVVEIPVPTTFSSN